MAAAKKSSNISKVSPLPASIITSKMVDNLESTKARKCALPQIKERSGDCLNGSKQVEYQWNSPSLMIVFDNGDMNSAMHHLLESLHNPFGPHSVATIAIQESIVDQFMERVVPRIKKLDDEVAQHSVYVSTLAKLQNLKAITYVGDPKSVPAELSPTIVKDFTHKYLGDGPTGVITLHTFRTAKEATQLHLSEPVQFSSVSIWNEHMSCAYEIAERVDCDTFFINCANVSLEPINQAFKADRSDVNITKGYHYESIVMKKRKIIVFPVGTIFAN
ncbi:uncharacterized protein LOC115628871 [Scaptodrosophila lebanonensis]|uniref:Uncharacterized protein LOC115628871 n=1 Tax=Drosophila lebanonensis TaxID=7225 RepID=A0A6J2U1G1_DROLE|nr:uncharacterized protein LOC115628871 [Scaptodrosophila lebanonensis]